MNSGMMRTRLTVSCPVVEDRATGSSRVSRFTPWNGGRYIWAQRRRLDGSGTVEQGEMFANYRAEFNIRIFHNVNVGYRVQEAGDDIVYRVMAVERNIPLGMTTLKCERVNL